jgi:hypothetical protein
LKIRSCSFLRFVFYSWKNKGKIWSLTFQNRFVWENSFFLSIFWKAKNHTRHSAHSRVHQWLSAMSSMDCWWAECILIRKQHCCQEV